MVSDYEHDGLVRTWLVMEMVNQQNVE
jgi:hypothetical protein